LAELQNCSADSTVLQAAGATGAGAGAVVTGLGVVVTTLLTVRKSPTRLQSLLKGSSPEYTAGSFVYAYEPQVATALSNRFGTHAVVVASA
jgi:hypothetical protein